MGGQIQRPPQQLTGRLLQSHVETEAAKLKRGAIGWFFGMANEKAGNIAGFILIVSLISMMIVLFVPADASVPKGQIAAGFFSLMTAAMGFLFGRNN